MIRTLIFLLLPILCQAQRFDWKRAIAPAAMSFVAGGAWGLHETLTHHWPAFEARHPGANERWWNPAESWKNKYKGGEPGNGRTGVPVVFTDAKHLLVSGHNTLLFGAGLTLTLGQRGKPWWHYALATGISFAAYSSGNYLIYNLRY